MRNLPFSPVLQASIPNALATFLRSIISDRRVNVGALLGLKIDGSGNVTLPLSSNSNFSIDGTGSSNNLDNILGALDGDIIYVRSLSSARSIVFKHGAGNLLCNGASDLTVASANDVVMCIYDADLAKWKCVLFVMG